MIAERQVRLLIKRGISTIRPFRLSVGHRLFHMRQDPMQRIPWTLVRDILLVVICLGIVLWAAFSILGYVIHAVVLLLLAMAAAFLVTPLVDFLSRYLPRVLAGIIVYILILAALGALCYALVFSLISK
jgi:predicted PurR-regulated permease PerM